MRSAHIFNGQNVNAAVDELLSELEVVLERVLAVTLGVGNIARVALQSDTAKSANFSQRR